MSVSGSVSGVVSVNIRCCWSMLGPVKSLINMECISIFTKWYFALLFSYSLINDNGQAITDILGTGIEIYNGCDAFEFHINSPNGKGLAYCNQLMIGIIMIHTFKVNSINSPQKKFTWPSTYVKYDAGGNNVQGSPRQRFFLPNTANFLNTPVNHLRRKVKLLSNEGFYLSYQITIKIKFEEPIYHKIRRITPGTMFVWMLLWIKNIGDQYDRFPALKHRFGPYD